MVRSGDPSVPATIDWTTVDGTATAAGGDYESASGTISFAATDLNR